MRTRDESLETHLIGAVRHLALPAREALAAKPPDPSRPDALALEFDDLYTDYVDQLDRLPSEAQLASLQALDSALTSMSGPANAALWTEASIVSDPRWSDIRDLARAVLGSFDS